MIVDDMGNEIRQDDYRSAMGELEQLRGEVERMRRAAKVDANQAEIVKALRDAGYSVAITSQLGGGFPDLVVGIVRKDGHLSNVLLEVKDGSKPPSQQKLTDDELAFSDNWHGAVITVNSVLAALDVCESYAG